MVNATASGETVRRTPLGTPSEIAAYLRKTEKTLAQWRWLKKGPPFVKVGGEVRYRWDELDEWLRREAA